ncbi:histidine phosphatase family protein [Brachybacterium sp. FME24]|uniref:histidine phosphatase family protein n=1 Tax=Brachybacterium sp. FME24 TaxID=2742605 RepID=UPI001865F980|nr:histidine phosphatase family protein [Brachybacterium sp. FME24]
MRELFVVTHPEATHSVEDRVGGWFDSRLTARGRAHAERIADALRERVEDAVPVFSSDLRRTVETATILANRLGADPVLLTGLREKSYGEAEGRPNAWLRERFISPPVHGERLDHDEGIPGSETKLAWARRVYAGMDAVTAGPEATKIIVTHGGSATFAIAHWLGMPLASLDRVRFRVSPGGITHLAEDDRFHDRTLERLNDTRHLGG